MKRYIGDVIEAAGDWLCVLTGHWHGCWLLNQSPVRRIFWWALNARWGDPSHRGHAACPMCHFARHDYVHRDEYDRAVERAYHDGEAEGLKRSVPYTFTSSCGAGSTITANWSRPC